jgi:hypothetical protein
MNATAVESSTLATVTYDDAQHRLQLEFCSGGVYQYFDVPAAIHEALLDAPSKGLYFNQVIRGRFPHQRMAIAKAPHAELSAEWLR